MFAFQYIKGRKKRFALSRLLGLWVETFGKSLNKIYLTEVVRSVTIFFGIIRCDFVFSIVLIKQTKKLVTNFQFKTMAAFVEPHYSALWQGQGGHGGNMTVVDKVPPEMLYLVDAHWYQFPPMNPLWHSILGFAIFVLGAISIIGNGVVIYIFTSTKSLRTPSNLLVVNLAISDFLV